MPATEAEAAASRRLAIMKPGRAYVIFDHALDAALCDGGWAMRDRLGYYRATDAGLALAEGHDRKEPTR